MEHTFETPGPVELYVEIDRGDLSVTAVQTGQSSIRVDGDQPERLIVEQSGDRLSAVVERRSLFDFAPRLQVRATVPVGSRVLVKTGSADVATAGALAAVAVTTGSGDVEVAEATGLVRAQTGSGDVRVGSAGEVRVKSGSGDLAVGEAAGPCVVQSGSGDVEVGHAGGAATLKTASGHIRVDRADADRLIEAMRLWRRLQGFLRVTTGGDFDPATASEGVKRALVKAGGAADLDALTAKVEEAAAWVRDLYRRIIDAPADALKKKDATA